MGLAVKEPRITLNAERSDVPGIHIIGNYESEVATSLSRFYSEMKIDLGVIIEILEHPPRHVGLGTGTQIILSAAIAISKIVGAELSVDEIAVRTGRGKYSWIGVEAFSKGGFIVSLGRGRNQIKQPVLRLNFPEDWFIVILIPNKREGLSGQAEDKALTELRYSEQTVMNIHMHLLSEVLPGILEHDIELFGRGVESIQRLVGSEFRSIQGGIYNRASEEFVELMEKEGMLGVGQSSWGPTVYGFTEKKDDAQKIVSILKNIKPDAVAYVTTADNHGVRVLCG